MVASLGCVHHGGHDFFSNGILTVSIVFMAFERVEACRKK
jgi:hypothetical protein